MAPLIGRGVFIAQAAAPSGGGVDLLTDWEGSGFPSDWTNNNGTCCDPDETARAKNGTQSLSITCNDASEPVNYAEWSPTEISGGEQLDYVEYWYYETSTSNGGGCCVVDSNGNDVIGFASSNPDWEIWDADGWSRAPNNNGTTDAWIRVKFIFDWGAGTCDIECEVTGGSTVTQLARPLINNTDVTRFDIRSFGHVDRGWNGGESTDNWYDDISMYKA